jgi:zinc protease
VDPAAASLAARTYVDPAKATIVIVGDASQFLDDLRELRGEVEVIPAQELDLASADLRRPVEAEAAEAE